MQASRRDGRDAEAEDARQCKRARDGGRPQAGIRACGLHAGIRHIGLAQAPGAWAGARVSGQVDRGRNVSVGARGGGTGPGGRASGQAGCGTGAEGWCRDERWAQDGGWRQGRKVRARGRKVRVRVGRCAPGPEGARQGGQVWHRGRGRCRGRRVVFGVGLGRRVVLGGLGQEGGEEVEGAAFVQGVVAVAALRGLDA